MSWWVEFSPVRFTGGCARPTTNPIATCTLSAWPSQTPCLIPLPHVSRMASLLSEAVIRVLTSTKMCVSRPQIEFFTAFVEPLFCVILEISVSWLVLSWGSLYPDELYFTMWTFLLFIWCEVESLAPLIDWSFLIPSVLMLFSKPFL